MKDKKNQEIKFKKKESGLNNQRRFSKKKLKLKIEKQRTLKRTIKNTTKIQKEQAHLKIKGQKKKKRA